MNWDAISATAEVVAGVAVVVSLLYVAIQIRLNTQELRAASFREVYTGYSRLRISSVENPAISALHHKALENPEEMSVEEKYRVEQFYTELTWVTHQLYAAIAQKMMEPRTWELAKQFLAEHLKSAQGRLWWQKSARLFDDDFVAEITRAIEKAS